MIKQVIKRDGRVEPFSPAKLNRWGEWASDDISEYVDWSGVVTRTVAALPESVDSQTLQQQLIRTCLNENSWSYYLMAGKLYAAYLHKNIQTQYGLDRTPTVKEAHQRLYECGLMRKLDYTDSEYAQAEQWIDHSRDFSAPHFALHQVRQKYSLQNRLTGEEYETQQLVYMRMAMALAEDEPAENRMKDVKAWYDHFSFKRINAPTPNFVNLGTTLRGFASCCVYLSDDNAASLAVGDHIAYVMTYMSAGIGNNINTRSIDDPVRGGLIKHQGRLPYYRSLQGAVKANLQNGRGGAANTYWQAFDPEGATLARLKNPRSPEDKKIRGIDYSFMSNKFFARKVARNEDIFVFNTHRAPDLWQAFFDGDVENFERLYNQYEADPTFKKEYISARELAITVLNEAFETGRYYLAWMDEMNRHTPFKEKIYSSNLCTEIALPTSAYYNMMDLYSTEDHGRGEVAICSLGGIVISNIANDDEYADASYYALKMIDKCIHQTEYALPHIGLTAKARMSAGVGIMGLAHYMAMHGQSYTTPEGKQFLHEVAERHSYMLIRASLRLGKELGNAPWIHKTKWPEGWLPIDTYNRSVDEVAAPEYRYDWEGLRQEIIANGGIRNSVVITHMPGESSSKASGTSNSLYPVRELAMMKSDNGIIIRWAAPDAERLADRYEMAWDIPTNDMIDTYAIFQKFTDQSISADLYRRILKDDVITSTEMIRDYLYMTKMGLKSRYYVNSDTSDGVQLSHSNDEPAVAKEQGASQVVVDTGGSIDYVHEGRANIADTAGVTLESIRARMAEGEEAGDCGDSCTL